jgi:quercetin dioxygenase-like cupin family protein
VEIGEPQTPRTGAQRTAKPTAGVFLEFDLNAQIEQLKSEPAWQNGRNAKTMVKYPDYRIVLMLMKAKTRIEEHHADGRISVQTIAGHIRMHVAGKDFDLPVGHLLALDHEVRHDVEALEDSAFLLTIARPVGSGTKEALK